MQLYTSLIRLKQAMNGGSLPVMTPLTAKARRYFDVAFLIDPKIGGMGGLQAHEDSTALRCPVRGCGKYFHRLDGHLNGAHGSQIDAVAVRRMLDIPLRVPLVSAALSQKLSDANRFRVAKDPDWHRHWRERGVAGVRRMSATAQSRRAAGRASTVRSVGFRNLKGSCPAQVAHRLIDLVHRLRRPVTMGDVKRELGSLIAERIVSVFGSLDAAVSYSEMLAGSPHQMRKRPEFTRDRVLVCLGQWYMAHGKLPSLRQAEHQQLTPLLPKVDVILRAMGTEDWDAAMSAVAAEMGFEVAA